LFEHPTSTPLSCVDLLPEIFGKNNFSSIGSLRQFRTGSEPDGINIVGRVMIIVVVRNCHDPSFLCGRVDSLSCFDPRLEFLRMGISRNLGPSATPASNSTVTSRVRTWVHIDRTPRLSKARGVTVIPAESRVLRFA